MSQPDDDNSIPKASMKTEPESHPPPPQKQAGMKRGPTALVKSRGTGFEEFFADPPMTPDEAEEEREAIYHPSRPFVERIEECVQRFRARRRLSEAQNTYFTMYLFLGGVDTSIRAFTGVSPAELREMEPAERRQATATDTVHRGGNYDSRFYNDAYPEGWVVDFTAVVAGYLSETVATYAEGHEGDAITVVEHFLRYVLQHDVCNEYEDDVKEALDLCGRARVEIPLVKCCRQRFPGQFNHAAAKLYCPPGSFFETQSHEVAELDEPANLATLFEAGLILAGDRDKAKYLAEPGSAAPARVIAERQLDLEVVEIIRPDKDLVNTFKGLRLGGSDGRKGVVNPIGRAVFKRCTIEDGWCRPPPGRGPEAPPETLLIDDQILAVMRPGFKLRVNVCELSTGLKFARQFLAVFPTYHTFLPQQLMRGYKAPVPDNRPAPCALSPDAGEPQEDEHDI